MLGFILSKMQMMIFAVAMMVIALMFFNFISGMQLKNITASTLELQAQTISGQLGIDSLCSFETTTIPEYFDSGFGTSRLYYDFVFAKVESENNTRLILSINEHGKEKIYDARNIIVNGKVTLVDPSFIASTDPISSGNIKDSIALYPRESNKGNQYAPPNAFVTLKEVEGGILNLYIIPCTTLVKNFSDANGVIYYLNNCEENILRVGCYKLSLERGGNPAPNDRIGQCFEIDKEIIESENFTTQSNQLSWQDCKDAGYVK